MKIKQVLDKGYVRLVDVMGSDLTVVNSARVSYMRESKELNDADKRLIRFLAEHDHTSPFRHAMLQFELYAPLMVARQHWKYVVGSDHTMDAWNESSRRYVTEEPEFYIPRPEEWRSAPENKKQGSGEPIDPDIGAEAFRRLMRTIDVAIDDYDWALENGICAEQARLFLPAYGLYVRYYWTASLQCVAHVLNQRLAVDAQKEFQEYAMAIYGLTRPHFEESFKHLIKTRN